MRIEAILAMRKEEDNKSSYGEALQVESGPEKIDDQIYNTSASAHTTGQDSWQQVGLMLVTGFSSGWIVSFSNLMLVPLGWGWGIPTLIIVAFFTAYANWLLSSFQCIQGHTFIRYRDIMGFLFGKKMYYITWILQFSFYIPGNMGFVLLGGRALKEINLVFSESPLRLQYFIIITGVVYFVFSFVVPNMSSMRMWLGASAILTIGYIGILLVATVIDGKANTHRDYEIKGSKVDKVFHAFGAVSAIIISNTSGMLPEIQSTVRRPAVQNMRRALYMQFTAGLMIYYGVTIVGYWAYGSEVSDYLPKELSGPKWAKIIVNSALFLQNTISQHMFIQPVHEALDTKFLKLSEGIYSTENLKRRFLLRAFVLSGITVVTAAIPFMGDFANLVGSFILIAITFIFPSIIYIKVKGKTARVEQKAWHWGIICVFSLLAVATTISAVRSIFYNVREYHLFADR